MKQKHIALLLACMLTLSACDQSPVTPTETESAQVSQTEPVSQAVLTHVFRESEIPLPDGFTASHTVKPAYQDGIVRLYGTKTVKTEEGTVREQYIYEYPLQEGEPMLVSLVMEELYANSGAIAGDKVYLVSSMTDPKTGESIQNLHVYSLTDGTTAVVENILGLFPTLQGSLSRLRDMTVDGEGYIYLTCEDAVCILNPSLALEGTLTNLGYIGSLATDSEGKVHIIGGNDVQTIDREGQSVTMSATLPPSLVGSDTALGEGYPLYAVTEEGLYGVQEESTTLLADWQNSNVNASHIDTLQILSPEALLVYTADRWCVLEKAADIDLSTITVVDLAYVSDNGFGFLEEQQLREHVVAYNKANPDTRVVVTNYGQYSSKDNPDGGTTKLLQDMLNGIFMPDLVFGLGNSTLITTLCREEMYTDLYTCMDDTLSPADMVGVVKRTFEKDGKLTAIPAEFQVKTILAQKAVVGERSSWTLEEMLDLALSLPADVQLMERATADEWMESGLAYASFIDMDNYVCHFDTPVFAKLLRYIASLPEEPAVPEKRENRYELYQTGQTVLFANNYRSIMDYQRDPVVYNSGDYVRIGYPDGGQVLSGAAGSPAVYLIPQNGLDKGAAWEFVKTVLHTPTEMSIMGSGNMRTLKAQNDDAKAVFSAYTSFYMYNGRSLTWMGDRKTPDENGRIDGQPGVLVPWSEEEFDKFTAWLDDAPTTVPTAMPPEVLAILQEEISTYLSGDRGPEETAAIVQSRVSIWLAERK